MTKLTEQFLSEFLHGGTIVFTCCCGRTHIASQYGNEFEDGEYEGYIEKSKMCADLYIFHDYTTLSVGTYNGDDFVLDCYCLDEKFGELAQNIWRYRNNILSFIKKELNENKKILDKSQNLLKTIEKI